MGARDGHISSDLDSRCTSAARRLEWQRSEHSGGFLYLASHHYGTESADLRACTPSLESQASKRTAIHRMGAMDMASWHCRFCFAAYCSFPISYWNMSVLLMLNPVLMVVQTYYYRRAPFVKDPPAFAAPDPDLDPEWYGEVYIRYPLSPTVTRMRLGYVMKATIALRVIMNDIALAQFASQQPTVLHPGHKLEFKRRLDSWMQKLPTTLNPNKILLPCHFNVQ